MKKEEYAFYIILLIGAILRFYNYDEWSLTNDELSALMRTQYDSFSLLLSEGVKMDGHPAATHVLEYFWIKIFGDSAFSIRFPFVIFGILSIYYAYRTASEWVGTFAALFVAATIAISEIFVLYSQIARPYSMGCFLVLFFTYYWTLYIKGNTNTKISIGFILAAALGILTHYFATLTIILILICGFTLLSKVRIKKYFYHILLIGLLCAPHIPITMFQLNIGGVGGWLPIPEANFILKYLDFISNNNVIHQSLYFLIPLISIFWSSPKIKYIWSSLGLLVFLICYLVGFFYSLKINAVLQFSVLIFSTPFLIVFIFSSASFKLRKKLGFVFLGLFLTSGLYALIIDNGFYGQKKFANYKGIAENLKYYEDSLGAENSLIILNSSNHRYFEYYFKELNDFKPSVKINSINASSDIANINNIIDSTNKEYIFVAWANKFMPYEIHEIVKNKYPSRIVHLHYFNSELSIFSKNKIDRSKIFNTNNNLENNIEKWEVDINKLDSVEFWSQKFSFKVDQSTEYAMTYRSKVKDIFKEDNRYLTITAQVKMKYPVDAIIVVSIMRDGEQIEWRGFELKPFFIENKWVKPVFVFEKNKEIKEDDDITIYVWNPSKNEFWIDDFSLTVYSDSNYDYYDLYK